MPLIIICFFKVAAITRLVPSKSNIKEMSPKTLLSDVLRQLPMLQHYSYSGMPKKGENSRKKPVVEAVKLNLLGIFDENVNFQTF
jgi:hypothetical protein